MKTDSKLENEISRAPTPAISNLRRFALSNMMLAVYFFSSALGATVALTTGRFAAASAGNTYFEAMLRYGHYYDLPIALIEVFILIIYERPIRAVFRLMLRGSSIPEAVLQKARRRLLNEPYFVMALAFITWLGAALFQAVIFLKFSPTPEIAKILVFYNILIALISVVTMFFLMQFCLQRWLIPIFFPDGKLSHVTGAIRITIAARVAGLIAVAGLVPFLIIGIGLMVARQSLASGIAADRVLENLLNTLSIELVIFSLLAVVIAGVVSGNLTRPFREIIQVLHHIKDGRLNQRVRVVSNDEIGYTADAVNEMAHGLREREKMRQSLDLAREVQQSLLPRQEPDIPGFDICGNSMYCDETGGDYYDFINLDSRDARTLAVVIGDVSGHGIASALLMTGVRAQLQSRTTISGSAADIIDHLNKLVSADTAETAQFMTLFYLEINCDTKSLTWVRAGHEPAILYDPETDRFSELGGDGLPLGVDPDSDYEEYHFKAKSGQILLLTTDGIFETRNSGNEMFGKTRFKDTIRQNWKTSSQNIRDTIFRRVNEFRGNFQQEDDVTLVTIKFL